MDFKEEDFPVYQMMVKYESDNPGVKNAIRDFEAAKNGGYEERFHFAFGLQTVVANTPAGEIQGTDQEMHDKTLRTCFRIFQEGAQRGHELATYMVQDFIRRNLGQPLPEAPKPAPKPPRKGLNFDF